MHQTTKPRFSLQRPEPKIQYLHSQKQIFYTFLPCLYLAEGKKHKNPTKQTPTFKGKFSQVHQVLPVFALTSDQPVSLTRF